MSEWSDIAKGGGAVVGVIGILHALRYLVPHLNLKDSNQYREKFQHELKNDPRIRDYIAEVRDDRIIKCLEGIQRAQESEMKIMRNIRDIAADTARRSGLAVKYDEE